MKTVEHKCRTMIIVNGKVDSKIEYKPLASYSKSAPENSDLGWKIYSMLNYMELINPHKTYHWHCMDLKLDKCISSELHLSVIDSNKLKFDITAYIKVQSGDNVNDVSILDVFTDNGDILSYENKIYSQLNCTVKKIDVYNSIKDKFDRVMDEFKPRSEAYQEYMKIKDQL